MRFRSRRGAEVVEMALVLPLLLLMVFGMVDIGLAIFNKAVITNAAREGARTAIVYRYPELNDLTTVATTAVNKYCNAYMVTFGSGTPSVTVSPIKPAAGAELTVTVTFRYDYVFLGSGFLGLQPLTLQGRAVMRKE